LTDSVGVAYAKVIKVIFSRCLSAVEESPDVLAHGRALPFWRDSSLLQRTGVAVHRETALLPQASEAQRLKPKRRLR
jgi:hypothetical protein